MTDFDRIRNLIIEFEHPEEGSESPDVAKLANDICKVCFARNLKIPTSEKQE